MMAQMTLTHTGTVKGRWTYFELTGPNVRVFRINRKNQVIEVYNGPIDGLPKTHLQYH